MSESFPLYLGPQLPRWLPRSVPDVEAAIADGTLTERHWIDAKAFVHATDGDRKELARDLASFANDGGVLLIGVAEAKSERRLYVDEVPLAGLPEQIDQIARSRCDPPLFIRCHPLAGRDASRGVLLVEIPPSPSAPHMVDGRYYGRADTTRHKLTDADVARLHAVRTQRQLTARQLIDREIARDPIPADRTTRCHFYGVALPLASPPDLFTAMISERQRLKTVKDAVPAKLPPAAHNLPPGWDAANQLGPRAAGLGFHTWGVIGRELVFPDTHEHHVLDLEVADDGEITMFCGRASDDQQVTKWSETSASFR